jgi:hypothetical protein
VIAQARAEDGVETVDEVVPTRLQPDVGVQLVVKQMVVLDMEPPVLVEETEQPT